MKKYDSLARNSFGGTLLKKSNAKVARPLRGRAHLHVVLKVNHPDLQLRKKSNLVLIHHVAKAAARRHRLRLKALHCDRRHIHFTLYLPRKNRFAPFIRALCGSLALKLSGASKRNVLKKKFWACRPWTCWKEDACDFLTLSLQVQKALLVHLRGIALREPRHGPLIRLVAGP